MQFAAAYRAARADFVAVEDPEGPGRNSPGRQFAVPKASTRNFTTMWRARQEADQFSIPYELYLEFCFAFAGRRKRRQVLQPNQCRPGQNSYETWFDRFTLFLEDRASMELRRVADVPQYDVHHFRGLPAQVSFLDYMEAEMATSDRPWHDLIATWSLERGLFPLMRYRRLLGADLREAITRAKATVLSAQRASSPAVAEEQFRQACYGLPGTSGQVEPLCRTCPQVQGCRTLADRVEQEVKRLTGHLDPVAARQREQGRLRKRRHDANRKEQAAQAAFRPEVTLSETIL